MKKEKVLLYTLAAVQFTHIMDFIIMMPMGEMLMKVLDIDAASFSYLVASYTLSAGISGFAGAFFLDRFDRKKLLLFFFLGFTLGTFVCAFASSYATLLIARVIAGLFGGVMNSIVLAIVSDVVPYERRAWALGIVMMAFSLASAFGLPVGLYFAFNFGWNAPFYLLSGMNILLIILIVTSVPSVKKHLQQGYSNRATDFFFRLLKNRKQLTSLLFSCLLTFGMFSILPFLTPYLVGNVGFEREQITYVYLVGGLITMFTNPRIGKWADRSGKPKVFSYMALASIPVLALITNLPSVHIGLGLVATGTFFFVASGRFVPAIAMITSMAKPENRGAFMSIDSSVRNGTAGLASLVAGMIIIAPENEPIQNFPWVGVISIVFTVLAIFLARYISKHASGEV